jgi:hypothetical protein
MSGVMRNNNQNNNGNNGVMAMAYQCQWRNNGINGVMAININGVSIIINVAIM